MCGWEGRLFQLKIRGGRLIFMGGGRWDILQLFVIKTMYLEFIITQKEKNGLKHHDFDNVCSK